MALNDESGTVRALAVAVAGRLAALNPAYIMPALRKHLMQLLSDMALSPDSKQREGVHMRPSSPYCCSDMYTRTASVCIEPSGWHLTAQRPKGLFWR